MNSNEIKKNSGITLIALVITIIVMLILVAVTISMEVNGGLFEYAGKAVGETENALKQEQQLINDIIDEYIKPNLTENEETGDTILAYDQTEKDANGFLTANATYTSGNYTAVVPKGFKISDVNGETEIATGLVIKDANNNEFVWIPVTEDLGDYYQYDSNRYEPKELTSTYSSSSAAYDSQATLDYLYGANYYTYLEDFKYAEEYAEMVEKVNEYNGFYIGRYETTIDSDGNIGTEYNTPVLTAGTTYTNNGATYYYRWYGLYYASKNADVTGNGTDVQTAMIYGVLYDKAMQFIRDQKEAENTTYDVDTPTDAWHTGSGVVNSAQANPGETGDVALNIWDLESNACEWTQEADPTVYRVFRGGFYHFSFKASSRDNLDPTYSDAGCSSRVALYIK